MLSKIESGSEGGLVESRAEKILDIMDMLSGLKKIVQEHNASANKRSTERAGSGNLKETMLPVKSNFLLGLRDQLKRILNEKLLTNSASVERINLFIGEIDKMIAENDTIVRKEIVLEDLPPNVQNIFKAANKEGLTWQEYINKLDLELAEKSSMFATIYEYVGSESAIPGVGKPVPQDIADRRSGHLTDIEDFIGQTISLLGEEFRQIT